MINLDFDDEPQDFQKKGYYFRPQSHICVHFLIEVLVKEKSKNCLVVVYEIGIPQRDGEHLEIPNGKEIATTEIKYYIEIDLWGKYFFPKFADDYQWYYNETYKDGEWVFDDNGEMDTIVATAEVMKFAIALGLELSCIEKY